MAKKTIVSLFFIIIVIGFANAQVKTFTIKVAGIKMGNVHATHIKTGNFDYYVTYSTIDVLLLNLKMQVKTESFYSDGVLVKANVASVINGINYISKTLWKNDHYDINCNTYKYTFQDTTLTKPIKWSTGKLYFEKPESGTEIYTESYGKIGSIVKIENNLMKMIAPKSKQIYTYSSDNTLLKLEVINNIKNFDVYADDASK